MAQETDVKNDMELNSETDLSKAETRSAAVGGETDTPETADEPEEIRAQIEETRGQMSETIDAIQERLSFANISEQVKDQVSEQFSSAYESVKDTVYDATIKKAKDFMKTAGEEISGSAMLKKAQDNPLPLVIIGLGIGLLAYGGLSRKKNKNKKKYASYRYDSEGGNTRREKSLSRSRGRSNKSMLKDAREKIGGAYEGVASAAEDAYESVTNAASDAYEGAGNIASETYKKVGSYGTQARETYDHFIEENPLVVGAAALAVGAAVGMTIPSTRYENELMGEARQNLMQKAQDSAGDLVEQVKDVVNEAGRTISEEVKNQGLKANN